MTVGKCNSDLEKLSKTISYTKPITYKANYHIMTMTRRGKVLVDENAYNYRINLH